jgi:hypothetical protein
MGLDITYYKGLTKNKLHNQLEDEELDYNTEVSFWINPYFPGRNGSIEAGFSYIFASSGAFRAGSYSGYNNWREQLAKFAGYPATPVSYYGEAPTPRHDQGAFSVEGGPFWELINFADNEGVIGPEVSAKLAKDFETFQERADAFGDKWWRSRYKMWREAFEAAAQGGAVKFH